MALWAVIAGTIFMRTINKIIMTVAGLLLIVAAGLKFAEMVGTCVPSWRDNPTGFWESYEFLLIQIPLEFALGVWMVSGLFRKAAWIASTLCYFAFIFVTIGKWVTGAESCGCFGQITVDPKITLFAMDIPVFLLLAIFRPKGAKLLPPPWPNLAYWSIVFVPTVALMVAAPAAMVAFRLPCIKVVKDPNVDVQLRLELSKTKQELAATQQELEAQKQQTRSLKQQLEKLQQAPTEPNIIDTTPENATSSQNGHKQAAEPNQTPIVKQWDWLQYVAEEDVRQQISEGLAVVLMYHHDCSTCAEMVPRYSAYYKGMTDQGDDVFKIAFLAIPPYSDEGPVPEDTTCILGKLSDKQHWQIMSPYVVVLLDGEKIKEWPEGTAPDPEDIVEEALEQH
jgi:hypothetical protein